ncbi:MAG: usg protein [Pseudomonadota bacterium]
MRRVDKDLRRQLDGYSLATAEITYRLPDARSLLQTFLWQEYDLAPKFPELRRFLDFWQRELDGPLHSVRVCHCGLIKPAEFNFQDHELTIH